MRRQYQLKMREKGTVRKFLTVPSLFHVKRLAVWDGLLRPEATLLELTTRGVNVAAAGIADSGLNAMHSEPALERLDLLDGRRTERTVGNVVELNQVDVAERSGTEVDERLHLRIGVVDAIDHGELVRRAATGLLDIQLNGLMETRKRVLLDSGHELVARALDGGVERDGEGELLGQLGEAPDARDYAAGRDSEVTGADCESIRIVEDSQCFDDCVEAGEWLALAHENDACHALAEIAGDMQDLIGHFLSGE